MRRRYLLLIGALVLVVFFAVSALLARVFSVDGAERSAITALVTAEARGDINGMVSRIDGCRTNGACRARVAQDAAALAKPGAVSIIQLQPSSGLSLGSTLGTARVAWNAGSSLPIVQCVRVRRAGNALSGLHVQLLAISLRIKSDADCPARF
jgi:hypothetical protein